MSHAALGDDLLSECPYLAHRPFQHDGLDALVMIEVGMHGGNRQVVMRMLDADQALGQFPFVVVIDVG